MSSIYIIGDMHKYFQEYQEIISKLDGPSIMVGDTFIGMPDFKDERSLQWNPIHKVMAGNHSNPHVIKNHQNYIGRYGFLPEYNLMWVDGAMSPDYRNRTEGLDWWAKEQLTHEEMYRVLKLYEEVKPRFVVSHDAPHSVSKMHGWGNSSLTQHILEMMTYIHKPELWMFGHLHNSKTKEFNDIQFRCIDILEVFKLPS